MCRLINWHKFFLLVSRSAIILKYITNGLMIHSLHFGRAFWLDEDKELCSAPWRKDGTVEDLNWDYVSEWTDLEGLDIGRLLEIHKNLIIGDAVQYYENEKPN